MENMKLSIGIPGDLKSMDFILGSLPEKPYEVYFSKENKRFGTSRTGIHDPDCKEFQQMIDFLKKKCINPNIVLNTVCFGNQQFSSTFQEELDSYLKQLSEAGIHTITLADPFLIRYVSEKYNNFKIVVSSTIDVRTQNNVLYYNNVGVERIIISPDLNRDLNELRKIIGISRAPIELLVNEGCLLGCPWKQSHHKYNAHKTRRNVALGEETEKYVDMCGDLCLNDLSNIIKSPFIRPEDICVYEKQGIEFFKIAGRNLSPEWIIKTTRAYQERKYQGNIVELLNSKEFLSDRINISNVNLRVL